MSYFKDVIPNIEGNNKLREPQISAYIKQREFFKENSNGEALVVLPTGTGKSGLIAIAPYDVAEKRVLVITPGLVTKTSVVKTLHPLSENFWLNYDVLFDPMEMPVVEEYNSDMLESSLEKSDFVIANVHKLYKNQENSLLNRVDKDFFDFIIIDEAHHSVANTWKDALDYFNNAKKLHITGTPYRGDQKELPGEEIHNTPLSEVMALRYVKWLRKKTINNKNLFFTMPGEDKKMSKDEVLSLKDKEWLEKSVALSEECSIDAIDESIVQLDEIKKLSPAVPHKILAVACSIAHAKDLAKWYEEKDKKVQIVHSRLSAEELDNAFLNIESHQCDVVVSVDMLKEGYDHKYLTVLALFRPFRSLNAFAQVIGRVLRAIPDNEITEFAIDNNAVIIYHEEIGLNEMWEWFAKEIKLSKNIPTKDYDIPDREYVKKEIVYASVDKEDYFVSEEDSYLNNLDFNELFKEARRNIDQEVEEQIQKLREAGISEDVIAATEESLRKEKYNQKRQGLDELLISKRPEQLRKKTREQLKKYANEIANEILSEKNLEPKGNELYQIFKKHIYNLDAKAPNDGILVRYINTRVSKRFGPVDKREPEQLLQSEKYLDAIADEIRRMI